MLNFDTIYLLMLPALFSAAQCCDGGHGVSRWYWVESRCPASFSPGNESATPTMTEDTLLPFDLPAASRKKVTADFGGGLISSDGGLVLLRGAERRLGLAETLAGCIREWRDPATVVHTLPAMLRLWTPPVMQANS